MADLGTAIRRGGRWQRRRDRWALVADGDTHAEVRDDGRASLEGRQMRLVVSERGLGMRNADGSEVLRVTHVTAVRQLITTSGARYRLVRRLGPVPVWQLSADVGGPLILELLAIGKVMRLRTAAGAAEVRDAELGRLALAATLGVWQARRQLPRPAAA